MNSRSRRAAESSLPSRLPEPGPWPGRRSIPSCPGFRSPAAAAGAKHHPCITPHPSAGSAARPVTRSPRQVQGSPGKSRAETPAPVPGAQRQRREADFLVSGFRKLESQAPVPAGRLINGLLINFRASRGRGSSRRGHAQPVPAAPGGPQPSADSGAGAASVEDPAASDGHGPAEPCRSPTQPCPRPAPPSRVRGTAGTRPLVDELAGPFPRDLSTRSVADWESTPEAR